MIVTIKHQAKAKMCFKGTRAFFEKHGLDFKDYKRNGIAEEKLRATGDAMAIRLCEVANGRGR